MCSSKKFGKGCAMYFKFTNLDVVYSSNIKLILDPMEFVCCHKYVINCFHWAQKIYVKVYSKSFEQKQLFDDDQIKFSEGENTLRWNKNGTSRNFILKFKQIMWTKQKHYTLNHMGHVARCPRIFAVRIVLNNPSLAYDNLLFERWKF
jgi:hypothetical protein